MSAKNIKRWVDRTIKKSKLKDMDCEKEVEDYVKFHTKRYLDSLLEMTLLQAIADAPKTKVTTVHVQKAREKLGFSAKQVAKRHEEFSLDDINRRKSKRFRGQKTIEEEKEENDESEAEEIREELKEEAEKEPKFTCNYCNIHPNQEDESILQFKGLVCPGCGRDGVPFLPLDTQTEETNVSGQSPQYIPSSPNPLTLALYPTTPTFDDVWEACLPATQQALEDCDRLSISEGVTFPPPPALKRTDSISDYATFRCYMT